MTSDASTRQDEPEGVRMAENLAEECANWIAEQLSDEFGGFVSAEMIDAVFEFEADIRVASNDTEMDHQSMAERLLVKFEEEGAPVGSRWGVTSHLLVEVMHWEDEFRALAGQARTVRPSRGP